MTLHRDPTQAWFWTPEWQAMEAEAERDITEGRVRFFESSEDFLAALEEDDEGTPRP